MLVRVLCMLAVLLPPLVAGATSKKKNEDRFAGLYIKDGDSGQLRFLTPTGGANSASINQLITQKQDLLEALRPTTTAAGGVTPIIVDLGGTGGTAVTSPTLTTGTGTVTGGGGGGGGNGAAVGASPVANLLPQIVAQGALGGGGGGGGNFRRRRVGNKRRRGNRRPAKRRRRRRPSKGSQGNAQVFVLRAHQTQRGMEE